MNFIKNCHYKLEQLDIIAISQMGRTMEKQYAMLLAWSSTLICKLSYLCNSEEKQILCMRTNQNASAIFLTWKLVHIADRDFHKKL